MLHCQLLRTWPTKHHVQPGQCRLGLFKKGVDAKRGGRGGRRTRTWADTVCWARCWLRWRMDLFSWFMPTQKQKKHQFHGNDSDCESCLGGENSLGGCWPAVASSARLAPGSQKAAGGNISAAASRGSNIILVVQNLPNGNQARTRKDWPKTAICCRQIWQVNWGLTGEELAKRGEKLWTGKANVIRTGEGGGNAHPTTVVRVMAGD